MKAVSDSGSGESRPVRPSTTTDRIKKLLVGMLILGSLTTFMSTVTFASFSAEVKNPASIQTGTLVLDSKIGAVDCYSTVASITTANSATCGSLFSANGGGLGFSGTQNLTIINVGSITAISNSSGVTVDCTSSLAPVAGFAGAGDLCNGAITGVTILVAETNSAFTTLINPSGPQVFGTCGATVASCSGANGPASGGSLATAAGALGATFSTRYYVVKVSLPSTTDNSLQGLKASLLFHWKLVE